MIQESQDGRQLEATVRSASGIATTVLRALAAAGVLVDDVEVRQPSLDDVFLSLTGHPASNLTTESDANEPIATGALL